MKNTDLQIMVHAKDVALYRTQINTPGIRLESAVQTSNKNYLFLNLEINKSVKPQTFQIYFLKDDKVIFSQPYTLKDRKSNSAERVGFTTADVLYLITPDRFANGDPGNDNHPEMREKGNRAFKGGRHGGDIAGIIKNLDYIKSTGSGKTVTIAPPAGQTIDGSSANRTITTQYKALVVVSDGANWYILSEFDGTF
jgi:hypothetical protein